MLAAFEKLEKILKLEQSKGYKDKAVIGGLQKFTSLWCQEARREAKDASDLQLVDEIASLLATYSTDQPARRSEVVRNILSKIEALPATPPQEEVEARVPERELPAVEPSPPQPIPKAPPVRKAKSPHTTSITKLQGVSTTYARRLRNLGVTTVADLLYLFPRRHEDFSSLKTINKLTYGEEVTVVGTIWDTTNRQTRKGTVLTTSVIGDETATIQATWFNQPYLAKKLLPGRQIVISGKVDQYLGRLTFQSPEWEPLEKELIHTGRLVPIYPLTKGLGARWLRRLIKSTLDQWVARLPDHLPTSLKERAGLLDLSTAIYQFHFPNSKAMLERARRRLCFDEFLLIQLGVLEQRRAWQEQPGQPLTVDEELLRSFRNSLPFALTAAQERTLEDILQDLSQPRPMSRLLQGDVGSGKTVVAAAAMLMAVANGRQAVMMAPTEILAEQHYKTLNKLFADLGEETWARLQGLKGTSLGPSAPPEPLRIRLLTGSLTKSEKDETYDEMASGQVDVVVGTHALIQEGVSFANLALAVIDEQHRFGVTQRATLRQKGYNPHILVMSATPIPRTLALTIYGDLDISVIDELPPGRQQIKTKWLSPLERERAYQFLRSQIGKGRQAFIICPLIEESEKIEAKAAVEEYDRLQGEIFPDLKLGLLHGRMKAREKEAVMKKFYHQELDILVSTPVVEVGIDVPNATVMLIEGADRFGLAQLHQFRGRVGRGEHQSYCLLLSENPTEEGEQRLKTIESTQDGFLLAEEDLKMRGPGEFFGTRQSGLPDLKVAKLSDVKILEKARAEAMEIFNRDPDLRLPEHHLLAEKVQRFWRGEGDLS
ncbi:MAG: ATP-dependent DNA helicase RecG [Anaerolineae bacterium]